MKQKGKPLIPSGVWCITSVVVLFGYLGIVMGVPNMLNTIMKTAHDLLLNTVFYLMSICVITGAIGKVFVEFGVVASQFPGRYVLLPIRCKIAESPPMVFDLYSVFCFE